MEALVLKKVYIVNNLKAKILIKVNVIKPENIRFFIKKKRTYVSTYNINILISTKR